MKILIAVIKDSLENTSPGRFQSKRNRNDHS